MTKKYEARIVKASRKVGSISPGLPGIPPGTKYYRGVQRAAGSQKHSFPVGRKRTRFYQGRFKSLTSKKIVVR